MRFASRAAGHRPLVLVGHGLGGQLLGLVDEMGWGAGLVMVGSALAHWRHWRGRERLRALSFWYLRIPVLTRLFGYLPGWAGIGVDLPAGVARQWSRWARHPDYLLGHEPQAGERFRRYPCAVLAFSFSDDVIAPEPAVRHLLSVLGTKRLQHRHLEPSALGRGAIGHLGFFRPELAEVLWPEVLSFVRRVAIREARLRSAWVLPTVRDGPPSSSDKLAATRWQ